MASETTTALVNTLDIALQQLTALETQLKTELAPLLERPRGALLAQVQGLYAGGYDERLFSLHRNKGNLIIYRGSLVLAELDVASLLQEVDAIVNLREFTPRDTVFPAKEGWVMCVSPAVCSFFTTWYGHPVTCVPLKYVVVFGERCYRVARRLDTISPPAYSGHASSLVDLEATREKLVAARKSVDSLAAKRQRVEEYEAQWTEHPALKKQRVD